MLKRPWLHKHTADDSAAESISKLKSHSIQLGLIINSYMAWSLLHRRMFGFRMLGVNSHVREPSIDSAFLLGAQADPYFVPLLFKHWCFLLSCDQALVGLEEHQRKIRGGSRHSHWLGHCCIAGHEASGCVCHKPLYHHRHLNCLSVTQSHWNRPLFEPR